jgi:FkbM family methyltransferase
MDWIAYDLALLHTASRFDLSTPEGRSASAVWLSDLFISLVGETIRPKLVLELGAADARFSRSVAAMLEDATVCALEANPYAFAKHQARAAAAGVAYHHLALGNAVKQTSIKVTRSVGSKPLAPTKGSNSLRIKPGDREYEDAPVSMVTVDHFVAGLGAGGSPCVMWIDVEGMAWEVLQGARETLKSTQALLVEVEDKPFWVDQRLSHEVKALLHELGFVPVARDFEFKGQYNLLCLSQQAYVDPYIRRHLELALARAPTN